MDDTTKKSAAASVEPAVRFEAVTKNYGTVTAVDRVSFDIAPASLVTLLGPSGCGKTTTLRLIAGLEQASGGRIFIGGKDVTLMSAAERDVSMVFQSYALFPHMNVMENVCYGLRAMGLSRQDAEARAAEKLSLVGLSGYEKRQPSELSGGQQQRVAVARAIVLEPQVLLFDEPLSNLDAKLRRRVREEIRDLQQDLKLTVAYVTHDQEEALAVSDRIIVMNAGKVAQDGTPRQLYNEPENRFIADFMGDANLVPVTVTSESRAGESEAGEAGDRVRVKAGPAMLTVRRRDVPVGAAQLAVRPHAIRIAAAQGATDTLSGTVLKSSYLGNHMEYRVALDEPAMELFVSSPDTLAPIADGSAVSVAFDPDAAVLIGED